MKRIATTLAFIGLIGLTGGLSAAEYFEADYTACSKRHPLVSHPIPRLTEVGFYDSIQYTKHNSMNGFFTTDSRSGDLPWIDAAVDDEWVETTRSVYDALPVESIVDPIACVRTMNALCDSTKLF